MDVAILAPEQIDPTLRLPKRRRVLLLCSYCDDEDHRSGKCTDLKPCPECLQMCNVVEAEVALENVICQFDQQ